ncbi:MAG: hypothetical protein ACE5G0_17265 [Rhodothermales bacterium]
MQDVLSLLTPADYTFLLGIIESPVGFTNDSKLRALLSAVEENDTEETKEALNRQMEREIRYLGSADGAYFFRYITGREPGVPFTQIVRNVAKALKVKVSTLGTDREVLEKLVQDYATKQFANLSPEQQQELLERLGVERDRAASFLKKSAGVFTVPMLIQAFGTFVVNGLIKTVIFGLIGKIIGKQLATRLFNLLVSRFPWWVSWIGPAAWTLSIGWAAFDIQGPAYRKTIPIVLYLGLCSLRESETVEAE